MGAISITAANVFPVIGSTIINYGIAGAAITQGQPLYIDTANGYVLKPADADASALTATVAGISINAASTGQQVGYAIKGPLTIGATLLSGDTVWLYSSAGQMTKTASDLVAPLYTVSLGVMTSTTALNLNITQGGLIA